MSENTAARLELLMAERGISKKELMRRTGLSESTITRITRRNMVGNLYTWKTVCDAIGITMNDLFEED